MWCFSLQFSDFAFNFTLRHYLEAADGFASTQIQALGPPFCCLAASSRGSLDGGAGSADGGAAMSCLLPLRVARLPPASVGRFRLTPG